MQDKEQKIVIFNRICMICFVCMTICYNISWDLFVITIFMVSAFCIGGFFFKKNNNSLDFLFQFGIGLGVISVILYYIFILGLGFISTIALIVIIPIIMNKKAISEMKERVESYKNTKLLCDWKFGLGILFFMFFCMYASAPIEQYDALSKHLPITLYVARTGQYYINLIESGVYCESMVSQYGFSAAFLILGAPKALVLFNVVLMFLCIGGGVFYIFPIRASYCEKETVLVCGYSNNTSLI